MTIYDLKPRFQALLRPLVRAFAKAGITANAVTAFTCALSVGLGVALCFRQDLFYLLPPFLFVRMALNAIDGMLAKEFGQKSRLGAFLNELTDVVSDAALALPFAFLPHVGWIPVTVFILLAALTEMAGVVAQSTGASRRYDGPFGKSDRAFVLGALALALALGFVPAPPLRFLFPILCVLLVLTTVNRVRRALQEVPEAR